MTDQDQSGLELRHDTPSVFVSIEGDLNINVDSKPTASAGLPLALLSLLSQGARRAENAPTDIHADRGPRKVLNDGSHVAASDPRTDHVAVYFPETGVWISTTPLTRDGRPYGTQQEVEAAARDLCLLGFDDWELASDKVYERHVIDRSFRKPAADSNLFPNLPLGDWYWTSTLLKPEDETASSPASSAFGVHLGGGSVGSLPRNGSGFGLACRRARQ